jgi:hypothetical protein
MVVLIINEHGVLAIEGKREPPIPAYGHRPMVFECPVQRMQPPAGGVHVFRGPCVVQREKLLAQPLSMARLDLCSRSRPEEQFDSLMTEALDHLYSV